MVRFNIVALTISLFIFRNVDGRCKPTSPDILGPYYVKDSEHYRKFCTSESNFDRADRLVVQGRVMDEDCRPVKRTRLDIWQADTSGHYYLGDCRGYIYTNSRGYYQFRTIHPGKYPVDRLRQRYRPAHLHFKIFGGSRLNDLVTQMYFAGDSNLGRNDSCVVCNSNRQDLVIRPRVNCDNPDFPGCFEVALFNIVLSRRRPHFRRRVFHRTSQFNKVQKTLSQSPFGENSNNQRSGHSFENSRSSEAEIFKPSTGTIAKNFNDVKSTKTKTFWEKDIKVSKATNRQFEIMKRNNHQTNFSRKNDMKSNHQNDKKSKSSNNIAKSKFDTSTSNLETKPSLILGNKRTMESAINRELERILGNVPQGNSEFSILDNTMASDGMFKPTFGNKFKTSSLTPKLKVKLKLKDVKATSSNKKQASVLDNMLRPASEATTTLALNNSVPINNPTPSLDIVFTPHSKKDEGKLLIKNEQKSVQNNEKQTTTITSIPQVKHKIVKSGNGKRDNLSEVVMRLDDILNFIFNKKNLNRHGN